MSCTFVAECRRRHGPEDARRQGLDVPTSAVDDTPTITIYNKQDLCEDEEVVFELDNLPKSDVDSSLSAVSYVGSRVDAYAPRPSAAALLSRMPS